MASFYQLPCNCLKLTPDGRGVSRLHTGRSTSSLLIPLPASSVPGKGPHPTIMAITQWTTTLRQCLLSRTSPDELARLLRERPARNEKVIVKALLDCRQSLCVASDPLPPRYLEILLTSRIVAVSDVLVVLVNKWNGLIHASRPISVSEADISSIQEPSLLLSSKLAIDAAETSRCLLLSSRWLTVLVRSMSQSTDSLYGQIAEAVGSFLATLSATTAGIEILSEKRDGKKVSKVVEAVRQAVDLAVGSFPALSVQLIDRLGAVQKHIAMFDGTQPEQSSLQALQIQSSVPEVQMTASRAGTRLYLEAMVSTLGLE